MKPLFYNFKLIHPEQLLPTPSIQERKIEHLEAIELETFIFSTPCLLSKHIYIFYSYLLEIECPYTPLTYTHYMI